mmetsp:Transcript_12327/g.17936  ORF Transcript_12327/g.17936 Transcript_12327/m.17936 type:complete len:223 (-) Transcript_12327:407-1075(-)
MTQQGIWSRLATTELLEHFHWLNSTSKAQHCITELASNLPDLILVLQSHILKSSESISGHDLSPLVRIVSSGVSTSKDVTERAEEPVFLKRHRKRCALLRNTPMNIKDSRISLGVEIRVKFHIKNSEQQLTTSHHSYSVSLLLVQLVKHFLGKSLSSLVMLGKSIHGLLIVTPVLHELRWELHCIPLYSIDSCNIADRCSGKHVLKTMSKLVEKSLHLAECH